MAAMAASRSPASSRRSAASSAASLKRSSAEEPATSASVPIDSLVNHLLAAKRSLSSMRLVVRANELVHAARQSHEDAAILTAEARFLRTSIVDQAAILVRLRRSLQGTYDWARGDFKKLIRAMDEVGAQLSTTMDMLRGTEVQKDLRPGDDEGEDRENLLDFVDEDAVTGMQDAMKKSIQELQGIQQSFDGDLLRFDTDIRNLKKVIIDTPQARTGDGSQTPTAEMLDSMVDNASNMAVALTSLTKHFDMCVTAIRTTEGAAALARRKVAEDTQSSGGDVVSISGVIAEQESNASGLEPKTSADRDELLAVVAQDADEVEDVALEIQERLAAMEEDHAALTEHKGVAQQSHDGMLSAYTALGEIGDRLADYVAADTDFVTRWRLERESVLGRLAEMQQLRDFYEGYASAYGSLVMEAERRRGVDERVKSVWRKAQETVEKLLEADRKTHEGFRQDVGEYLPTDLWAGLKVPASRWEVRPVTEAEDEEQGSGKQEGRWTDSEKRKAFAKTPRETAKDV